LATLKLKKLLQIKRVVLDSDALACIIIRYIFDTVLQCFVVDSLNVISILKFNFRGSTSELDKGKQLDKNV